MSIQLDTDTLERVQRAHRHPVAELASFFGACEAGRVYADGRELTAWRKSGGAALAAWRGLTGARRRALQERWRPSAEALTANALRRNAVASPNALD